jgi:nucleotide-binding universal stress UspA family protein
MARLLVAVDGSEVALRALDFAARQAAAMADTRLHVLYVQPPMRVYGEIDIYVGEERMREIAGAEGRQILDAAAERVRIAAPAADFEQLDGDPGEAIPRRAVELGCAWIVMGTHGRGRIGSAVMGSVAQKVIHHSSVPVTLVR